MPTSWPSFRDQLGSAVEAFVTGHAEPYARCRHDQRDDPCDHRYRALIVVTTAMSTRYRAS